MTSPICVIILAEVSAILPLLAFLAVSVQLFLRGADWRSAVLISATIWGGLVLFITELLSLFNALTPGAVLVCWIIAAMIALALAGREVLRSPLRFSSLTSKRLDRRVLLMVGSTTVLLCILGLIALTAAPSSGDAMQYHLPRVMHWLQNRSVAHYPTTILRQIYLAPWSGYVTLHFQALTGRDYLANSVQWFSLVIAVLGASRIAMQLGATALGQAATGILVATIPMALLQATHAENHLVVGVWLICFVSFMFDALASPYPSNAARIRAGLAGAALGLAILTKASAYFFAAPFVVWFAVAAFRKSRWTSWQLVAPLLGMTLAVNVIDYSRQIATFGSPLGPGKENAFLNTVEEQYSNQTHTPAAIFSNIVRNVAIELSSPSQSVNSAVAGSALALHRWLGIDPNDRRTSWTSDPFAIHAANWNEDTMAGNPVHFLLLASAMTLLLLRHPQSRSAAAYSICVLLAFLLFCGMLKWNPWLTRLHLPLLMLAMPLIAVQLERFRGGMPLLAISLALGLLAIPYVVMAKHRVLIGADAYYRKDRFIQYYCGVGEPLADIHLQIADACAPLKPTLLGLQLGRDDAEYPLWMALTARGVHARIIHFEVNNESARYYEQKAIEVPQVVITAQLGVHNFRVDRTVVQE